MKELLFSTLLSVCLLGLSGQADAQSQSPFRLRASGDVYTVNVNKTYTANDSLTVLDSTSYINGLCVTMNVVRHSSDFMVRLLLEDSYGRYYLVAESYPELANDEDTLVFTQYCEETANLSSIYPKCLKILVRNAEVSISTLNIISVLQSQPNYAQSPSYLDNDSIRHKQLEVKVNAINDHNHCNNKLWEAGITNLCLRPFEEKMQILGCPLDGNTYGMEYYVRGIMDIGVLAPLPLESSPYINSFDWREKHGKNWTTSVKDQGNSGYCSAFSAISCTEALLNLYLNDLVNIDLSEQEAASCNSYTNNSSRNFYKYGMPIISPLEYIRNNGVCDESSYPFVDDSLARFCQSDLVNPEEIVTIDSISTNLKFPVETNEDRIKRALIKYGPLASGIYIPNGPNHAMALIGYGKVEEGMIIQHIWNYSGSKTGLTDTIYINANNPLVGRNYWIFKNSYIAGGSANPPYMLVAMDLSTSINSTYALFNPRWKRINASGEYEDVGVVICEDGDGDGFFYWGLGPKPESFELVPDQPDGDDSNPLLGVMNEYGYCENLNPETRDMEVIFSSQTTLEEKRQYSHLEIVNNSIWTIAHDIRFYNGAKLIIRSGSTVILANGSTLQDVEIVMEAGATLTVIEDGIIKLRKGVNFAPPIGAVIDIEYGEIN